MVIYSLENYDSIVNYIYKHEYITEKIIDFYREFVLNDLNSKTRIISLDKVVYEYLYNDKFNNYIKEEIKNEEENINSVFFSDIEYNLKKLHKKFLRLNTLENTRWL